MNNATENGHLPIQAGEVLWTGERRRGRTGRLVLTFTLGALAAFLAMAAMAARVRY
jgi:hypothetical protein